MCNVHNEQSHEPGERNLANEAESERHQREQHNATIAFFKLPPEIRNTIYGYCLPIDEQVDTEPVREENPIRRPRRLGWLKEICRATRRESLPIYYGRAVCMLAPNRAGIPYPGIAKAWLSGLSSEAMSSLRRLCTFVHAPCQRVPGVAPRLHRSKYLSVVVNREKTRDSTPYIFQGSQERWDREAFTSAYHDVLRQLRGWICGMKVDQHTRKI